MTKAKSQGRSGCRRFLLITGICLLIIACIIGVVYWQWENITSWITDIAVGITQLFGWGIIIVVFVILTLATIILSRPILLLRYWNKWIGGLILLAAIWGGLAFFNGAGYLEGYTLGGRIGQTIIGESVPISILIVAQLFIIGLFFVVPRWCAQVISGFFAWIFRKRERAPAAVAPAPAAAPMVTRTSLSSSEESGLRSTAFPRYKPEPQSKPVQPVPGSKSWLWNRLHPNQESSSVPSQPVISGNTEKSTLNESSAQESLPVEEKAAEVTESPVESAVANAETSPSAATEAAPDVASEAAKTEIPAKDLKQVAQEVWKKYGEAVSEVTADGWKIPPIEILDNTPEVEFSQADNMKKAKLIEDALSSYGVESKVVQINVGPTVTQFGIEPGWDRKLKEVKEKDKNGDVQVKIEEVAKTRVKVDRITSLSNDLALALAAPSIRIEAPVPGKSVVGIEVPNTNIGSVSMRSVVESNVFQKMQAKAKLSVALGKGAGGESVVADLTKMPHLLIAGATGSGKTVCIHGIICCLLLHNTPNDVRFIMIDPKRVELTTYNSLPHLAMPVIVDNNKAILALRGLGVEMDRRYQTLAAVRSRNIEAYNKLRPNEKLPYVVLIIDELADLMMTAGEEVEHTLCRLAQLARAVGIHLVVATQRPSVDVVTGLIKANFPTRISFAVTSQVDSRTILDSSGAEKLLGRGDMLYMPTEAAKAKRLQGCFLSDPEIERLVYFWNNQKKEIASQLKLDDLVAEEEAKAEKPPADPLLEQARKLASEHNNISASFLQRHLRIGYPRAARLMEQLEEEMGDELVSDEPVEEDNEKY